MDVAISVFGEGEFDFLRRFSIDSHPGAVLDAGAYTGLSALALTDIFPDRMIVCLEPEPDNYAVLLKNINGHPRIIPMNCALGDDVLRGDTGSLQGCAVVLVELHDRIRPGCSDAFRSFSEGCEVVPVGHEKMCAIRK